MAASKFNFSKIFVLGFGFLGISLLWAVYNDFVPVLLQAGRPDFSRGAGVRGYAMGTGATGLIMGLDNLAALFILPYIGGVSDRLRTRIGRRKPFILAGAPVAAIAFAAVPFTLGGPLGGFMAALIVTLLAMDLFRTPVVALMPDLTPPHLRSPSNGIINFMGGLGGVVASLAGGYLFRYSPAAPFILGAGGMLAAQTILMLTVREPEVPEAPEDPDLPREGLLSALWAVLRSPDRSALCLLGAICFWFLGQSAFDAWFSSYAIQRLGLDAGHAALLKSWFSISALCSALPCGALGAAMGRKGAILLGLVLFAAALGLGGAAGGEGLLRPVLVVSAFAWMLVVVNSLPLVLDFAPGHQAGTYTGLYYLASQTAAFLGPVLSGNMIAAFRNDYRLLFPYTVVALLGAAGLTALVRNPVAAEGARRGR